MYKACGMVLLTQGLSVLYYSNDILSKSLPSLGPYLSLGITVVNVIMTFPAIILIEVSHFFPLISSVYLLTACPIANGQETFANPFGSWLHHISLPPWLWLEHWLSYAFKHHHRVIHNVGYLATSPPHKD